MDQLSKQDRANIIAQMTSTLPWKVFNNWMIEQYESHRAALENPHNPDDAFTKGEIAAFKNIFSFIKENENAQKD